MRIESPCSALTASSHSAASALAATSAVGLPPATSCAKLGPDSTPTDAFGSTDAATWWPSAPVADSTPLHSQNTQASSGSAASLSRSDAIGVATTSNPPCACAMAAAWSEVTARSSGHAALGR